MLIWFKEYKGIHSYHYKNIKKNLMQAYAHMLQKRFTVIVYVQY